MSAGLRYHTTVTRIGPLVAEFAAQGVLVLFGEGAPEELHDFSILHRPEGSFYPVVAGDVIVFGSERRAVTAIGDVANENLERLGHAVFKCNGRAEAELPGDICLEAGALPEVAVGEEIRIEAGT